MYYIELIFSPTGNTIMRIPFILSILVGLFLSTSIANASDQLVTKASKYSVAETLNRLTKILKSKGITVFARVNHAAGAKKVGLEMRPTEVLIFGNPKLGGPLMIANQKIGLALPLKAVVYKDKDNKVWLSYRKADDLKQAYSFTTHEKVFMKMSGALGKLTDKAVN
jgi:uncharacterized protein (DUF302 family)